MGAAIVALVVLTGLIVWRERAIQQERERWEAERRELLNRIKPETAIPLLNTDAPAEPSVEIEGPTADDDYWENRRVTRGVTS